VTLLMRLIFAVRTYDLIYIMTRGGPGVATDLVSYFIYRTAFGGSGFSNTDIRMSYAIAMSLIVFLAMAVVCWGMIKVLRRREIET